MWWSIVEQRLKVVILIFKKKIFKVCKGNVWTCDERSGSEDIGTPFHIFWAIRMISGWQFGFFRHSTVPRVAVFEHRFLDTAAAQCRSVAAVLSILDDLRIVVWIFQTQQQHSPRSRSQWMGRLRNTERRPTPNPSAPWRWRTRSTDSSATCWSSTCVDRKRKIWTVRVWLIVNALAYTVYCLFCT